MNDLNQRDIIDSMINNGVSSVFDFKWLSVMKFYWEDEHLFGR